MACNKMNILIDKWEEEWEEEWNLFEKEIKFETRFFNSTILEKLRKLFNKIESISTHQGKPLIIKAGPDTNITSLYRARVFQVRDRLIQGLKYPDENLSAPPSRLASSGRMNAKGISVFYGATTPKTAIAEVRPPVGSEVVTAIFKIIRHIRLLDLTALRTAYEENIFDPNDVNRLKQLFFLSKLSNKMVQAVMPDDQELEYLPTQAIADFLATECNLMLDGILFPSLQDKNDGLNVILFHKSARCLKIEIPEGMKVDVDAYLIEKKMDYETVLEYKVNRKFSSVHKNKVPVHNIQYLIDLNLNFINDCREETLSIDLHSIKVHKVDGVSYFTTPIKVHINNQTPIN